jgi:hypothetical protein
MSGPVLAKVARDMQGLWRSMPKTPPQMSWRLHPVDFLAALDEMHEYTLSHEQPFLPLGGLYIMGLRVFEDADCPRLDLTEPA